MAEHPSLTAARAAAAAHRGLRVEPVRFAAHLRDLDLVPAGPALDDVYVAFAAASGDPAGVEQIEREVMPAAEAALRVFGATGDTVVECMQRVRERLFVGRDDLRPRLLDYRGEGRLRAWVRVVALREVLMLHRARKTEVALGDAVLAAVPDRADDPELVYLRGEARDALAAAVEASIARLDPRARTLLRYSLVDGLALDEIGAIYKVHKSTVSRWLSAARDRMWRGARAALVERLGESVEVTSLVRGLRSGLDLSLERLLAPTR